MSTRVLFRKVKGLGHEANDFHLVQMLRMNGALPPFPHITAWYVAYLSIRDDNFVTFTCIYKGN
jgi:hypothetical protein